MAEHWERHKHVMARLFLTTDTPLGRPLTLNELIEVMRNEHGFDRKKAQYERQFRAWRLRKNIPLREWRIIKRSVETHQQIGRRSRVYWCQQFIDRNKLNRGIARASLQTQSVNSDLEGIEADIYVSTPPEGNDEHIIYLLQTLPWVQFISSLETPGAARLTLASVAYDAANPLVALPRPTHQYDFTFPPVKSKIVEFMSGCLYRSIPGSIPFDLQQRADLFHSYLRALIPDEFEEAVSRSRLLSPLLKLDNYPPELSIIIYLVSNGLIDLVAERDIAHYLNEHVDEKHLRWLLTLKLPITEALADRILVLATTFRYPKLVSICLDNGANSNGFYISNGTYLQIACSRGTFEISKLLLEAGADPNRVEPTRFFNVWLLSPHSKFYPIQTAAISGNIELLRLLLEYGADVNAPAISAQEYDDYTRAEEDSSLAMIDYDNEELIFTARTELSLLDGTRLEATDAILRDVYLRRGSRALEAAAARGHIEAVRMLLDAGANPNFEQESKHCLTGIEAAVLSGRMDIIQLILQKDMHQAACRSNGLFEAVLLGNFEIIQYLIANGVDPNATKPFRGVKSPLQVAVRFGELEILNFLLDHGACLEITRDGLFSIAMLNSHTRLARKFLNEGMDIHTRDCFGYTALEVAAEMQNRELLQFIIDAGIDIRTEGGGALAIAAQKPDLGIFCLLLEAGASLQPPMAWMPTALELAALAGDTRKVQMILDRNLSSGFWARAEDRVLLHITLKRANYRIQCCLLEHFCGLEYLLRYYRTGFSVLRVVKMRKPFFKKLDCLQVYRTALEAAIHSGSLEVVQMLLLSKLKFHPSPSLSGIVTALQEAIHAGNIEMTKLLLSHNSNLSHLLQIRSKRAALNQAIINKRRLEFFELLLPPGHVDNILVLNKPEAALSYPLIIAIGSVREVHDDSEHLNLNTSSSYAIIRFLLTAGANLNIQYTDTSHPFYTSPLQAAVYFGNVPLTNLLLQLGADIDFGAQGEKTVLEAAINTLSSSHKTEIVTILISAGADVNAVGYQPPIFYAAYSGNIGIAVSLIRAGANVAMAGYLSALGVAASHGYLDMVKLLIVAGAGYDSDGIPTYRDAMSKALRFGHRAIYRLIKRHFEPDS